MRHYLAKVSIVESIASHDLREGEVAVVYLIWHLSSR